MADNDIKELKEFFEKKFDGFEKRFDQLRAEIKDDLRAEIDTAVTAAKEETMRHTGVLIEAMDHKIDIVIEGVKAVNEKLDRRTDENEKEHAKLDKRTLINTADISKLDQRVGRLEGKA